MEWVWSQGPLYWSSLSYTQSPYNLAGLQLGQLSGPITVTAAIVAVNGLLAEAWYEWRVYLPARQYWGRYLGSAIALFVAVHLLGLGLYSRPLADRPAEALDRRFNSRQHSYQPKANGQRHSDLKAGLSGRI